MNDGVEDECGDDAECNGEGQGGEGVHDGLEHAGVFVSGEDACDAGAESVEGEGEGVVEGDDGGGGTGERSASFVFPEDLNGGGGVSGGGDGAEDDAEGDGESEVLGEEVGEDGGGQADEEEGGDSFSHEDGGELSAIFFEEACFEFSSDHEADDAESEEVDGVELADGSGGDDFEAALADDESDDDVADDLGHA